MSLRELLATQARIIAFIRPYWKVAVGALFFTIFVALTRLSQAKFAGWLFELMTETEFTFRDGQDPFARLNWIIGAFMVVIVCRGFGSFAQKYLVDLAAQSAVRDLRTKVFAHLQELSLSFYHSMRVGEIQSRCSSDVIATTSIYATLSDFLKNSLILVLAVTYMFYTDWKMTMLVFLLSPVIGIAVGRFGKKIGEATESLQSRVADLTSIMFESISNTKVIKAYHREEFENERFGHQNEENFRTQMKLVQVSATQTPVVEFLSVIGIIAIVYFGASQILQKQSTFAQMTEYWTLMAMIIQPITAVSGFYSSFQASATAGKRVFSVLDTVPDVQEKDNPKTLPTVTGNLSFKNVHFHYSEDKPVLRGIDLEVQAGEVVAIVGTNGAGKTSFVNLVPRFYDPTEGSIEIDGHDLRDLSFASLRTQVGTVIQESILFHASIADNIACGRTDYTREQIIEAAKVANAHDFVAKMPDGYDSDVGERGGKLSGGQRQRIAIARALLRDPKVLILDEFTSGIDTESENLITEAIERIMKGRTSLVIAHRLNTIRHADRIIVLDAGKIVEHGTHEKLLAENGLYTKLYEAQLRSPISSNEPERKGA